MLHVVHVSCLNEKYFFHVVKNPNVMLSIMKLKTLLSYLNLLLYFKDCATYSATAQLQLFEIFLLVKLPYYYYKNQTF